MLNTLFVTSEDAYLALENENIIVFRGEAVSASDFGKCRFVFIQGSKSCADGRMRKRRCPFVLFNVEWTFSRQGQRAVTGKCAAEKGTISRFG